MGESVSTILLGVFVAVVGGLVLAGGAVFLFAVLPGRRPRRMAVRGRFPPKRVALLDEVARAFGGAVVNDPATYRFPLLRAQAQERPYAVGLVPVDPETRDPAAPYIVCFEAPLPSGRFVEAWPEGSPFPPRRMTAALPDVEIGDPAFDGAHLVKADDAAFARAVLSPELRSLLGQLRKAGNGGRVRFDLYPYKLAIQKEEQLEDYGSLFQFTRGALAAFAEVKGALESQSGMKFYDGAPPAREKPVCPVCGATIAGPPATCLRCKTPHHADCWKYFGMCSMFACGERRRA